MPATFDKLSQALHHFWSTSLQPQPVLVAVSGGPDSLALLHCLLANQADFDGLSIYVAHFNHQIRGETADRDSEFVAEFCRVAGLTFYGGTFDVPGLAREVGLSLEEAARQARYAYLAQQASQLDVRLVLTGHNADDQAETVLLRLLRGTGPTGLRGMLPVAGWPPLLPVLQEAFSLTAIPDLVLARPLLTVWRSEIEAYCAANGLMPCQDETNLTLEYRRNRLRQQLIPLIEADYQPNFRRHLTRLADLSQADQAWLAELVNAEFQHHARLSFKPYREVNFSPEYWQTQPLALQRRLVRQAVDWLTTLQDLEAAHVEAVLNLFETGRPGRLALPGGLVAFRLKQKLGLLQSASAGEAAPGWPLELTVPGSLSEPQQGWSIEAKLINGSAQLPGELWQTGKFHARLDYAKIGPQLHLRPRQPGDRFRPLGAPGRRKVQDILVDAQVPREQRDQWPLVVCGQPAVICWIPGVAIGEDFKIEATTSQILDLQFQFLD